MSWLPLPLLFWYGPILQLKIFQEVITPIIFCLFSTFYLKNSFKWDYVLGLWLPDWRRILCFS